MSNQVYSNTIGAGTPYRPSTTVSDTLGLAADIPAVDGVSLPYGRQTNIVDGRGYGLYMTKLNGVVPVLSGGITRYDPAQSPHTLQFWRFSSVVSIDRATTYLHSLADNVISVSASIPARIVNAAAINAGPGPITTFALCARVFNADGTVFRTYGYKGFQNGIYGGTPPVLLPAATAVNLDVPLGLGCVVPVPNGKKLAVVIIASTLTWADMPVSIAYEDFLAPQPGPGVTHQVQVPCEIVYTKL